MSNLPHAENIIKPTTVVLHYPFLFSPVEEPFCPVALSEYLKWGWSRIEPVIGGCIQLTYPNTQFRMVS